MSLALLIALVTQQPPPAPLRVPDATGAEHPVYRDVRADEHRDEGLLRRIACPARGPVALVVKLKDKVVQYSAPTLRSIDFIVYRKDFRGPVSCEGFGGGLAVYVTWKQDGKARRAVAVEILPR